MLEGVEVLDDVVRADEHVVHRDEEVDRDIYQVVVLQVVQWSLRPVHLPVLRPPVVKRLELASRVHLVEVAAELGREAEQQRALHQLSTLPHW